mmetsp:Transcript_1195/g.1217  ORF Transcript_1195/g.1217 Transcript_1195/m.1217 type:complete len:261 (+) Transcript_1195:1230-2012(+)
MLPPPRLDLLEELSDLLVVLRAVIWAKVMEPNHQVFFFLFDFINFLLFIPEFLADFIDFLQNLSFILSALGESLGEFLVLPLHALQQDQFLKVHDQLHLRILQVTLESILLPLHFLDFLIEVVDQVIGFLGELLLLVGELDLADLLHFPFQLALRVLLDLPLHHLQPLPLLHLLLLPHLSLHRLLLLTHLSYWRQLRLFDGFLAASAHLLLLLLRSQRALPLQLLLPPIVLNVIICHLEELLWVLHGLVDGWLEEVFGLP